MCRFCLLVLACSRPKPWLRKSESEKQRDVNIAFKKWRSASSQPPGAGSVTQGTSVTWLTAVPVSERQVTDLLSGAGRSFPASSRGSLGPSSGTQESRGHESLVMHPQRLLRCAPPNPATGTWECSQRWRNKCMNGQWMGGGWWVSRCMVDGYIDR